MPANSTYYCATCDVVSKGPHGAHMCDRSMQNMGRSWKPGRKGSRTRVFDKRKAPTLYFGYCQLPFEPPRRIGRKRARALREGRIRNLPVRDRNGLLPYWYIMENEDPRIYWNRGR